ncbi:MAG: hypothetical protein WCK47_01880 [bacterium]|nr:hypothetical protein [Candidatus Sumerlaeota bacterium]
MVVPVDYARMDNSLKWCETRGLKVKGFGYVYMTRVATPVWMRDWSYDKLLSLYRHVVRETMRHYGPDRVLRNHQ